MHLLELFLSNTLNCRSLHVTFPIKWWIEDIERMFESLRMNKTVKSLTVFLTDYSSANTDEHIQFKNFETCLKEHDTLESLAFEVL